MARNGTGRVNYYIFFVDGHKMTQPDIKSVVWLLWKPASNAQRDKKKIFLNAFIHSSYLFTVIIDVNVNIILLFFLTVKINQQ